MRDYIGKLTAILAKRFGWGERPPCDGSAHVVPVPPTMDVGAAWAEMTMMGRLSRYRGRPSWAVIHCPGGEACDCRGVAPAPIYRRHHNDRLVELRIFGVPIFKGRP